MENFLNKFDFKIQNIFKKVKIFLQYFSILKDENLEENSMIIKILDKRLELMENEWQNFEYKGKSFTLGRIKILRRLIKEYLRNEQASFKHLKDKKEYLNSKRKKILTYLSHSYPNFWN